MSYQKKNWQDLPNTTTPITATELNRMENGIADANGAIGADAYDSTATYAVNDLCIYNNTLYICTTAISTAEAWNSNHWKAISVDDMLISKTESNNVVTELNKTIDVSNISGTATTSKDGLMSKEDKVKLDGVVERGHNSYGDWVKFGDGTMICTATISLGNLTYGTAYGAVYRTGTYYSWTFPQEFANTNDLVFFGNIYAGTAIGGTNLRSPLTTTKAEYFLYIMSPNTVDTIVYVTAIGKWK